MDNLDQYIRELVKANKLYRFYKTKEWRELRDGILYERHYECQRCLEQGVYTQADCVHHVNEVKRRPLLALSKTYIDKDGKEQPNLIPLCNACHNITHDRVVTAQQNKTTVGFTNEERW